MKYTFLVVAMLLLLVGGIFSLKAQRDHFPQTGYYTYNGSKWMNISKQDAYSGKHSIAAHVKVRHTPKGKAYEMMAVKGTKEQSKQHQENFFTITNPAQNAIQVRTNHILKNATLSIYDMAGKLLVTTPCRNNQSVNVSALANGMYMAIVKEGNTQSKTQFIINR